MLFITLMTKCLIQRKRKYIYENSQKLGATGTSVARSGGGVGTKLAVRVVAFSSGLRISTGRRGVELRRWPRGQEGLGINGGEEIAAA